MEAKGIAVDSCPNYLKERFSQLMDEQRAYYAAMSESRRIEAWDEHDREQAVLSEAIRAKRMEAGESQTQSQPEGGVASPSQTYKCYQSGRWNRDIAGELMWPRLISSRRAMTPAALFSDDLRKEMRAEGILVRDYGAYMQKRLCQLTPEQHASYAARSEAARIKAWDESDMEAARHAAVRATLREKWADRDRSAWR